jgi:hypothetical protein
VVLDVLRRVPFDLVLFRPVFLFGIPDLLARLYLGRARTAVPDLSVPAIYVSPGSCLASWGNSMAAASG